MAKANFITLEDIAAKAPSVLRDNLTDDERFTMGRSQDYQFFSTAQIIEDLGRQGWHPVDAMNAARQRNPRKKENKVADTARHMVRFRNNNFTRKLGTVGDLEPEILITNSHDGTAKFKFHVGLFRLVCSNGLVIADRTFDQFDIRHYNSDFENLRKYVKITTEHLPEVMEQIDLMKNKAINNKKQLEFATRALTLRYPEYVTDGGRSIDEEALYEHFDPKELLEVRRDEDGGSSIWNVYNRVQEALIKGKYIHHTEKEVKGEVVDTSRQARAIDGPKSNIRNLILVNKGLWSMATSYAGIDN